MKNLFIALFCAATLVLSAQCPTITMPSTLALTNCSMGISVMAVASYSSNISSRWFAPGNIPLASSGTDSSIVYLNYATTYTVEFTDNSSSCVVSDTIQVFPPNKGKPTFSVVALQNYSVGCGNPVNNPIQIINASATGTNQVPNGGPVTYTLFPGTYLTGPPLGPGILSTVSNYSVNTCGANCVVVRDNMSGCQSSFDFKIECSTVQPTGTLVVSPNLTVCAGSSATLAASGLTTYTWNVFNGISPSGSVVVVPYVKQMTFFVTGMDNVGCTSTGSLSVSVDSTCAMVWPGDCNRDGVVDNTDIFEIGLNFNNTGSPRTSASNNYIAQKATLWNGSGSFSQNECHIDSNGDGLINADDTLAIFNNYLLTHSFKPSPQPYKYLLFVSTSPPIQHAGIGLWNSFNVTAYTNTNTVYGIAFVLHFEKNDIDSIYMTYPNSFMTAAGQNVFFRKADFNTGKVYCANVKNTGLGASGSGTVAVVHFKLKNSVQVGKTIPFMVSNVKSCDPTGSIMNFDADSLAFTAQKITSIKEENGLAHLTVYPNPANEHLNVVGLTNPEAVYQISDIAGRLVSEGVLTDDHKIDVTQLSKGSYLLKISNNKESRTVRVQIVR